MTKKYQTMPRQSYDKHLAEKPGPQKETKNLRIALHNSLPNSLSIPLL
jgi:hypothetical protein